jgi:hypothetical protein
LLYDSEFSIMQVKQKYMAFVFLHTLRE